MSAPATTWTQGVADDGTLQTFTPCPSEHHKIFWDPTTNQEMWGLEDDLCKLKDLHPSKALQDALGVIVVSGGFMYYQVVE
jgi:hypothetical protein